MHVLQLWGQRVTDVPAYGALGRGSKHDSVDVAADRKAKFESLNILLHLWLVLKEADPVNKTSCHGENSIRNNWYDTSDCAESAKTPFILGKVVDSFVSVSKINSRQSFPSSINVWNMRFLFATQILSPWTWQCDITSRTCCSCICVQTLVRF